MKIYFLSGLGADETVFQFLQLQTHEAVHIQWIKPLEKETLPAYALRIKAAHHIPDDAVIVGLSFGGMLATEIAKQFPKIQAILISYAKTKHELPTLYQLGKYFPLHLWSSERLFRWFMQRNKLMFGLKDPLHIAIHDKLIANADISFNKWAVEALINWDNTEVPSNIVHIHGTHDKIIPYKNIVCHISIKKGEHLMVMEQAVIVSKYLQEIIAQRLVNLSSSASPSAHPYQV